MDRGEALFRAREARERAAEEALLADYEREQAEKAARERASAQAAALAAELERRQREHDARQRLQQKVRRAPPLPSHATRAADARPLRAGAG